MSIIVFLLSLLSFDNTLIQQDYIAAYKDIAVIEMQRTGVPASIKLAQALLESNSGLSSFAQNSKNHFGIKCKTYWRGKTFYHQDDDRDKQGKLLESCFRAYERVIDSYVDHSNFLKYSSHYQHLFSLAKTDYISWAKGLKQSGYATDPLYDEKLIKLIEKHQLYTYDLNSTE